MPAKKKFVLTVVLNHTPAFPLRITLWPKNPSRNRKRRIFLAYENDYDVYGVISISVNGVAVPADLYIGVTKVGSKPRCGFVIREDVLVDDFELVVTHG